MTPALLQAGGGGGGGGGGGAFGAVPLDLEHLLAIAMHLGLALGLGALLAYRPWRRALGRPPVPSETAQSQALVAVAGAILVTMIGDSLARAFGLVGLGGFIRFRSGIKDPRDAAVMFVSIGVGMACGMGLLGIAVVTSVFVGAMLVVFDASAAPGRARIRISVDDAPAALPALQATLANLRVVSLPTNGARPHDLVVELDAARATDAAAIQDAILRGGVRGIHAVEVIDD